MTTLALHREINSAPLIKPAPPQPRLPISIRVATERDLKFIDALMKKHSKMVGFASTEELLTHINGQTALIAEEGVGRPIGYCLYHDRYMKREDCGIVSQLNVAPNKHRGLVGAALIKAMFERVPYGVRLFCCWCAQDLEANHFWEALGFVPLAFRCGSRGKEHGGRRKETRVHIFWQRRVRDETNTGGTPVPPTPYWFPSLTSGGRAREQRIALPIPPGTHWSDAKPVLLPGVLSGMENQKSEVRDQKSEKGRLTSDLCPLTSGRKPRSCKVKPTSIGGRGFKGGLWFAPPPPSPEELKAAKAKEPKPRPPKFKNDPKYVAAARELRDRYLEQINTDRMLPSAWGGGKYDVSRQLEAAPSELKQTPLLQAA